MKQLDENTTKSVEWIKLTEKILDFDVFRKPYDRTLRNKIIHKDFKIDYNNRVIIYSSQKISFKNLLIKTRNILEVLVSINYIYNFISRKKLQKAHQLLITEENVPIKYK